MRLHTYQIDLLNKLTEERKRQRFVFVRSVGLVKIPSVTEAAERSPEPAPITPAKDSG